MLVMTIICNSIFMNLPTMLFSSLTFINDTEIILICRCSGLEKNVQSFSTVVIPLADNLKHCSDVAVKRSNACVLKRLSK